MKLMLLEYAQIAEIVGAFAIILSLIFVGYQLNDNAKATRSATASATIASMSLWYAGNGQSVQASANFLNAMENPDELTREQWFQFVMNFHAFMLNVQNSYYLVEEGTLDLEIRDSLTAVIMGVKDQSGFQLYWKQRKAVFFLKFQDYIDTIIASKKTNSNGLYKDVEAKEENP